MTLTFEERAEALLDMDDEDFEELVIAESRGDAGWVTDIVESDLLVCERWVEALQGKSQRAMAHIQSLKADEEQQVAECSDPAELSEIRREFKKRRSGTNYFRAKVDDRLREAKACRSELRREEHGQQHAGWYSVMLKVAEAPSLWDSLNLSPHDRVALARVLEL